VCGVGHNCGGKLWSRFEGLLLSVDGKVRAKTRDRARLRLRWSDYAISIVNKASIRHG
jgi:hypothetical protein